MKRLELVWFCAALSMLVVGIAGAFVGWIPSDVGLSPLWFVALGLLAFPLGLEGFVTFTLLLGLVESRFLGPETHFSSVAFVCLSWCVVVACGMVQAVIARRVAALFLARRQKRVLRNTT